MDAKQTLLEELRRHALILGEVTLTSGATAQYYVDAKRAILRPAGFRALGELVAGYARPVGGDRGGRPHDGRRRAGLRRARRRGGREGVLRAQGGQGARAAAQVEGPPLEPGERCLIVEDVVTSGGSTVQAIEAVRAEGHDVCGVVAVLDRLAGGAEAIRRAAGDAPYEALATIDELYPDRPDAVPGARLGNTVLPLSGKRYNAPSRIRTCGLLLRRESLYPAELSGPKQES